MASAPYPYRGRRFHYRAYGVLLALKAAFEFGMKNGNLLKQGKIVTPEGLGPGMDVDWHLLDTADFYRSSKI
jgi:hypothetical protein